jgi:hypothetical protein
MLINDMKIAFFSSQNHNVLIKNVTELILIFLCNSRRKSTSPNEEH